MLAESGLPAAALSRPVIVVPCYNEARRIDRDRFLTLAQDGYVRLLFVNDGSTDTTGAIIRDLAAQSPYIEALHLIDNYGKAEAVRTGLRAAIASGVRVVGYYDADMATPPSELLRLVDVLDDRPEIAFVLGARVALLGQSIDRTVRRHCLGRIFASLASMALGMRVYDTQCGAKLFRVTPAVEAALCRPFRSSWGFDVELLSRLLSGGPGVRPLPRQAFAELPLREWADVDESKLTTTGMVGALGDVALVAGRRVGSRLLQRHDARRDVLGDDVVIDLVDRQIVLKAADCAARSERDPRRKKRLALR